MEKVPAGLSHLFMTAFLSCFSAFMVIPAITDITLAAVCPGQDECSLAIYLTGIQQAVCITNFFNLTYKTQNSSVPDRSEFVEVIVVGGPVFGVHIELTILSITPRL